MRSPNPDSLRPEGRQRNSLLTGSGGNSTLGIGDLATQERGDLYTGLSGRHLYWGEDARLQRVFGLRYNGTLSSLADQADVS